MTTPAVAVALLVIMLGLALIIDRIWLETSDLELNTAAEAAALAAAGELASEELLKSKTGVELRLSNARQTAAWIASQNYVGGTSVILDIEPAGDVRFGNLVDDSQGIRFEESEDTPTTVVVTILRTRANKNPIALFVGGLTGLPFGDVAARTEATISNDIVGLRPFAGSPIPVIPIAIWKNDPTGQRSDTWDNQIEANRGPDQWSWDEENQTVVAAPDGLPEIVLHSLRVGGDTSAPNVQLLDLGTSLKDIELTRQFQSGVGVDDLQSFAGELIIGQGVTIDLNSSPELRGTERDGFQSLIGERRLCFVYSSATPRRQSPMAITTCTQIVAVRVLVVSDNPDGSCDVTVQPTVLTTRTAMLASENVAAPANTNSSFTATGTIATDDAAGSTAIANRYLYKLRLTQ
jgi:hypothetical protein